MEYIHSHAAIVVLGIVLIAILNIAFYFFLKAIYNEPHEIDDEIDIFRYSKKVAWLFMLLPIIFGSTVYLFNHGPTLEPFINPNLQLVLGVISGSLIFIVGVWYRSFNIVVDKKVLFVRSCFGHSATQLRDIVEILVINSGRSGRSLSVLNYNRKRVLYAFGDLQDFDELVLLLKFHTSGHGVKARSRDSWGNWSDL